MISTMDNTYLSTFQFRNTKVRLNLHLIYLLYRSPNMAAFANLFFKGLAKLNSPASNDKFSKCDWMGPSTVRKLPWSNPGSPLSFNQRLECQTIFSSSCALFRLILYIAQSRYAIGRALKNTACYAPLPLTHRHPSNDTKS